MGKRPVFAIITLTFEKDENLTLRHSGSPIGRFFTTLKWRWFLPFFYFAASHANTYPCFRRFFL
jgi:hypothetical protein